MATRSLVREIRPLAHAVFPRAGMIRDGCLVVGASVLVALCAQISIPLPFTPVPLTAQTLAVLLVGATLGSRLGALAMLAYVGEGLVGLPVFAGGMSAWGPSRIPGVPYILGPTAGYLIGFVAAAAVVGWLAERRWDRSLPRAALAMLVGQVLIYACGLSGLARFLPGDALLAAGLLPFLPGDALKIVVAALALPGAWRVVERWRGDSSHGSP